MRPGISLERSELVASYETYEEAQEAVDRLSDHKLPVERLAIVASDLSLLEQVTGRMGYGSAALHGAVSGAFTGVLLGLLVWLFTLATPVGPAGSFLLWLVTIGAVLGVVVGLISYAAQGGRRHSFSSVVGVRAGHYDVVADPDLAPRARQILAG